MASPLKPSSGLIWKVIVGIVILSLLVGIAIAGIVVVAMATPVIAMAKVVDDVFGFITGAIESIFDAQVHGTKGVVTGSDGKQHHWVADAAAASSLSIQPIPRCADILGAPKSGAPSLEALLLATGLEETGAGTSTLPGVWSGANSAGAGGPMQFEASTFDEYASILENEGPPPNWVSPASLYSLPDALDAAALMDCENVVTSYAPSLAGHPTQLASFEDQFPYGQACPPANGESLPGPALFAEDEAVYQYNHACWYVAQVEATANRLSGGKSATAFQKEMPTANFLDATQPHLLYDFLAQSVIDIGSKVSTSKTEIGVNFVDLALSQAASESTKQGHPVSTPVIPDLQHIQKDLRACASNSPKTGDLVVVSSRTERYVERGKKGHKHKVMVLGAWTPSEVGVDWNAGWLITVEPPNSVVGVGIPTSPSPPPLWEDEFYNIVSPNNNWSCV